MTKQDEKHKTMRLHITLHHQFERMNKVFIAGADAAIRFEKLMMYETLRCGDQECNKDYLMDKYSTDFGIIDYISFIPFIRYFTIY